MDEWLDGRRDVDLRVVIGTLVVVVLVILINKLSKK